MKCIIPNQNVKIIARAIHSLAKIGDEMFIEPLPEEINFRTVNMAHSAFAEFKMTTSFFSSFSFSDPDDSDSLCKVTMRSCINVFKNMHNLEKQVENCEIRLKPNTAVVIFLLKFTNAPMKKYYLPVIESEKLEANILGETANQIKASSKMLMSTVKNFRYSEDEITITAEKEQAYIKNHVELKKDISSMRTELCFHPSEFETYSVSNPACITFCFKELRAVLLFAEPSNLSVSMCFSSPGMPIMFKVENSPAYEANYIVSTLNANISNLGMNLTRHSRLQSTTQRPHSDSARNGALEPEVNTYTFMDGNDPYTIQQCSEEGPLLSETSGFLQENITPATNCKEKTKEDKISGKNVQPATLQIPHKRSECNPDATPSLTDRVESVYSSFSSSAFHKQSNTFEKFHTNENTNNNQTKELIKIVFSRCFGRINSLENITGNNVVLAEGSDNELV